MIRVNAFEQIMASPVGGTLSLTGDPLPTEGYFVGGVVSPLILDPEDSPQERADQVKCFAEHLLARSAFARFLGWWTDEETGRLWVDGVSHHATEYRASRFGRIRREIAIYDIVRGRELRLVYAEGE
jgi:hypothetical protein